MIHLTGADYRVMPWANGKGQTTELVRQNDAQGNLLYRLSVATVTENGPFSVLPGIKRNLTVISGPGFDLTGDAVRRAGPLTPIAFDGGLKISASGVSEPSEDFNVMVGPQVAAPRVMVIRDGAVPDDVGTLFCFAIEPTRVGAITLARRDLLVGPGIGDVRGGPLIVVRIDL